MWALMPMFLTLARSVIILLSTSPARGRASKAAHSRRNRLERPGPRKSPDEDHRPDEQDDRAEVVNQANRASLEALLRARVTMVAIHGSVKFPGPDPGVRAGGRV